MGRSCQPTSETGLLPPMFIIIIIGSELIIRVYAWVVVALTTDLGKKKAGLVGVYCAHVESCGEKRKGWNVVVGSGGEIGVGDGGGGVGRLM